MILAGILTIIIPYGFHGFAETSSSAATATTTASAAATTATTNVCLKRRFGFK